MKKLLISIPILFFSACFLLPNMEVDIPDEPLEITMKKSFQSLAIIIELFSTRQEQRIYDELFSDSLKTEILFIDFKTEMANLNSKYGGLAPYPMSHMRSMVYSGEGSPNELDEPVIFRGLLEYEKKTVYFSISLKGKIDNLKISSFTFIEN
ncbi:MAG: hypothetical protein HOB40_08645 [Candidatus Marinimicrobia bacterium]|nr:hypothetical protein [Candidatus Neomarinimicrobiota bacterium]MBT3839687.1 hypothetical protein [Candidatus Neomarinimicrobiota bacterium]MBT4282421.1 hypothetical protein [Candidatus Neomarinimicrobiota bacterium]MBT4958332.1 hypothetical protein [Candidatus Neomarinimicrobiota bacterium]MBT5364499.1 hypothetical protein [Candidatus Neomarinimicrobiota bacterium]